MNQILGGNENNQNNLDKSQRPNFNSNNQNPIQNQKRPDDFRPSNNQRRPVNSNNPIGAQVNSNGVNQQGIPNGPTNHLGNQDPVENSPGIHNDGFDGDFFGNIQNNTGKKKIGKIILIVLVILSVIGLVVIGFIYKSEKDKEANILAMQKKIEITANENNGLIDIKVKALNPIERIVYSWNNETENETALETNGETFFEHSGIEIPAGENTFSLLVQDKEGNRESFSDIFKNEEGLDIEKPEISISTRSGMIVVEVKDNQKLQSVAYRWSDDSEYQNVSLKKDEESTLKFEIEPETGDKTLTVRAIDSSKNTEVKEEIFKGVVKPKIEVKVTSDTSKVIIEATHPVGIKNVVFSINGQEYKQEVDSNDPNKTKVRIVQELRYGLNKIIVKAISEEGYESEDFVGQTERPQPQSQTQPQTQFQSNVNQQGAATSNTPTRPSGQGVFGTQQTQTTVTEQ